MKMNLQLNNVTSDFVENFPLRSELGELERISSSEGLNWPGVAVQRARVYDFEVEQVSTPFHCFSLLTSANYSLEIKRGTRFYQVATYEGQVHVRPANFEISARSRGNNECIQVALAPERLLDPFSGEPLSSEISFQGRVAGNDPQLKGLIETLIAEAEAGGPNGLMFVDSVTTALAVHYVSHYSEKTAKLEIASSSRLSNKQMVRVREYMDSNLSTALTLDDIAKEMGMSKYYFSRLFKKTTGTTPYQFLMMRRMEKARNLLDEGQNSITEIAHRLNFSDQSHFNRVFKKSFGMTPRKYLKH